MTEIQTPIVSYKEAETRILTSVEWNSGDEMEFFVKERYKKIVCSRYRTWYGLCFVAAGASMLAGANPFLWFQYGWRAGFYSMLFSWAIAAVCIGAAFLVVNRERDADAERIDKGNFLWKVDAVYARTPDHYPKKSRIWIESEKESVVILQAFFWFNKGDKVFVVKEKEDSKELQAFIL